MKSKTMWLTRDEDMPDFYEIWSYKGFPSLDDGVYCGLHWNDFRMCRGAFEQVTGIKLKPGEKKKIRIEIL